MLDEGEGREGVQKYQQQFRLLVSSALSAGPQIDWEFFDEILAGNLDEELTLETSAQ